VYSFEGGHGSPRLVALIPWVTSSHKHMLASSLAPHLVAMGSFLNPDTTRIIAKRIILTGHPFKVHKKTATVRYMFFNRGLTHFHFACPTQGLQMMYNISNRSNCTPSMAGLGIFRSHWAPMDTSRHTLMDQSIKWTPYL